MKKRLFFAFLFTLIFIFPASAYYVDSAESFTVFLFLLIFSVGICYFAGNISSKSAEETNKELRQQISQLISENNELKSNLAHSSAELSSLSSELASFQQRNRELVKKLHEKESSYAELKRMYSQVLATSHEIPKLRAKLSSALNQINTLKKESPSISTDEMQTKTKLQTLKKEYDDLKSVLARREHEFSQLQQAYDTLRASLRSLDSAEYKMLKPYLSVEEYQKLPQAQMHRLALERYQKRQRSEWEVGLGFERLIGYRYEKKGYTVEYVGATSGKEDMGRDLIVSNETEVFIVQCKRWSRGSQIHEKHIFQLQGTLTLYQKQHPDTIAIGVFITTAMLSPKAKETALSLGIEVAENFSYTAHPLVKCKADTKQYYLPMDSEYDKISINFASGDCYHKTVESAISAGFQSAYQ